MNSNFITGGMKVPTRPAPPPPSSDSAWANSFFGAKDKITGKSNVPKKKAPPPRPPPPKIAQTRSAEERGSQLVSGLFPRRSQSRPIYEPVCSLIDWVSPPSSPTSTTRSSSDALSVNSFGSDSVTPSSGSNSNVESGFEDDFELFGAPSSSSRPADPWSPPPQPQPSVKPNWVSFSPSAPKKLSMPTIIRAKPERPKPPKILEKKIEMTALAEVFRNVQISERQVDNEDIWSSDSPPMPAGPPPALPPEFLSEALSEIQQKTPNFALTPFSDTEVAVALFDYTGQPGDLSFRQGDRIRILRRVDENWVEAALAGRQGTAPTNFLQFENKDPRVVRALFAFAPETWEDLELQVGSEVRLLGKVNSDWLYGEIGSRRGQFPTNFVDRVPADLPSWTH